MAAAQGSRQGRVQALGLKAPQGDLIPMWDAGRGRLAYVRKRDFESYMDKMLDRIKDALTQAQQLGPYKLQEIDLAFDLRFSTVVLSGGGGVTLSYKLP